MQARKNLIILIILVFTIVMPLLVWAQPPDFTGIKVMINPGHGGHDSDDRGMPNGFWESEGNLTKGLWLRDLLEARGCEVVMSRVQNRTEDDLPLSQIAAMANQNQVDLFISIHSNASNQSSNFPLTIFNGKSETPAIPEAKVWAQILWEHLITNKATHWTNTDPHYIGDLTLNPSFTYGYGVLYPLTVPGIISEGSFHDYQPEMDRLLNSEYCKQEAWNMYFAMVDYFEFTQRESLGQITGILRDSLLPKANYTLPNSPDKYQPVNKAIVTIIENGQSYLVDSFNTGFYYFDSLSAGTYNLVYEAPDYFNDTVMLEVKPHAFTYMNQWQEADKTMPPKLLSTSIDNGATINCFDAVCFTFTMNMDSATVANAFSIAPEIDGQLTWDEEKLTVCFQPNVPYNTNTEYTITIQNTAQHQWGVPLEESISLTFITANKNRYQLEQSFPAQNEQFISPYLQFQLVFDAPIKNSTLINAVKITSSNGTEYGIKGAKITVVNNKGHFYFVPETNLNFNEAYTLHLAGTICDINNIPLVEPVAIHFTTEPALPETEVIDAFETITSWSIDGAQSSGIDANTFLYRWTNAKMEGSASMLLRYNFLSTTSEVVLAVQQPYNLPENTNKTGLWIWGDYSQNNVHLIFDNETVLLTTLDFAGWKYVSVEVPKGFKQLLGLKLENTGAANFTSDIYFDYLSRTLQTNSNIQKPQTQISVYPIPVNNGIVYLSGLPQVEVNYKIFNLLGAIIQQGKLVETNFIELNNSCKKSSIVYLNLNYGPVNNTILLKVDN